MEAAALKMMMRNNNNKQISWGEKEKEKEKEKFHVIHKVPCGDGPYVRAKHAQVSLIFAPLPPSQFLKPY